MPHPSGAVPPDLVIPGRPFFRPVDDHLEGIGLSLDEDAVDLALSRTGQTARIELGVPVDVGLFAPPLGVEYPDACRVFDHVAVRDAMGVEPEIKGRSRRHGADIPGVLGTQVPAALGGLPRVAFIEDGIPGSPRSRCLPQAMPWR